MTISQCVSVALAAVVEPPIGVVVATGLVIVFTVLVLLYLIILLEGVIFKSIDSKKSGAASAPKKADKPAVGGPARAQMGAPAVQQGIPGEVVAAISAALSCMEGGGRYVIRSVTRAKQGRGAWGNAAAASYTEPF